MRYGWLLLTALWMLAMQEARAEEMQILTKPLQRGHFVDKACKATEEPYCESDCDVKVLALANSGNAAFESKINNTLRKAAPGCWGKRITGMPVKEESGPVEGSCAVDYHCDVTARTERLLSIVCSGLTYCAGAAHPIKHSQAVLIDLVKQKIMHCNDLFPPTSYAAVNAYLLKRLDDARYCFSPWPTEDENISFVSPKDCLGEWWVDKEGVDMIRGDGSSACDGAGVTLSRDELAQLGSYAYIIEAIDNNAYAPYR